MPRVSYVQSPSLLAGAICIQWTIYWLHPLTDIRHSRQYADNGTHRLAANVTPKTCKTWMLLSKSRSEKCGTRVQRWKCGKRLWNWKNGITLRQRNISEIIPFVTLCASKVKPNLASIQLHVSRVDGLITATACNRLSQCASSPGNRSTVKQNSPLLPYQWAWPWPVFNEHTHGGMANSQAELAEWLESVTIHRYK